MYVEMRAVLRFACGGLNLTCFCVISGFLSVGSVLVAAVRFQISVVGKLPQIASGCGGSESKLTGNQFCRYMLFFWMGLRFVIT